MNIFRQLLNSIGIYKGKRSWSYVNLHDALLRSKEQFVYTSDQLPDYISMHESFWQKCREIQEYTKKDGHEYAISVWSVDGEMVVTPPFRGDMESVRSQYKFQLQYIPHDDHYATKQVTVNGEVVLSHLVLETDIPEKSDIFMLFHMHTHPPYKDGTYSFFSTTDIDSLLNGHFFVAGIITDTIYLMIKSRNVAVNTALYDGHPITESFLSEKFHIGVYKAHLDQAVFEKVG